MLYTVDAKGLAKAGFTVFTFDFCGGGLLSKSDGKFIDMLIDTEKQDLLCVIDYVSSLGYVDVSKLILIGESHTVWPERYRRNDKM